MRRVLAVVVVLGVGVAALLVSPSAPAARAASATSLAVGISPGADALTDSPAQVDSMMAGIAAAGGRWVRLDVPWSWVEGQPGVFDWSAPDRALGAAHAHGLTVDAILDYAPAWGWVGGQPDPAAFAEFATQAVQRYAPLGVHTYEIWNEENLGWTWDNNVSPAGYGALLRSSYSAIKTADSGSIVLLGGLGRGPDLTNGQSVAPYTFLSDLYTLGFGPYFDAANLHPYSYPDFPNTADSWNPFWQLPQYHSLMTSFGDGAKALWITEYGAPTGSGGNEVTEPQQANMLKQALNAAATEPWLGPFFVYNWQDDASQTFGLLRADGSAKPALAVFSAAPH